MIEAKPDFKIVPANNLHMELHPGISEYVQHLFDDKLVPTCLKKAPEAIQTFLTYQPLRVSRNGDKYFAFGGLQVLNLWRLLPKNELSALKILLLVHKDVSNQIARKCFAAELINARALANTSNYHAYKCPSPKTSVHLLLKEWPDRFCATPRTALEKNLRKTGFLSKSAPPTPFQSSFWDNGKYEVQDDE